MKEKVMLIMFSRKLILFILLTTISINFQSCKDNSIAANNETELRYPTTIYSLSQERIHQLQDEFDHLNNYKVRSVIDNYGFIGQGRNERPDTNTTIISQDAAFKIAVNTLLLNSKFTNITDSIKLVSSNYSLIRINSDGSSWGMLYISQNYNGYEVLFTDVRTIIHGDEPYWITGHWYSDIYIPSTFIIDEEKARQNLIGEKIIWHDSTNYKQEFIVTKESIIGNNLKAIYPLEKENSIELRVVWKIAINIVPNFATCYAYIDVMNGKIVNTILEYKNRPPVI